MIHPLNGIGRVSEIFQIFIRIRLNMNFGFNKPLSSFFILFVLCSQLLFAQISVDTLKVSTVPSYPIIYGESDDKYPDSLYINGVIQDVSFGVSCGVFCGSGTIKVKLSKLSDYFPEGNIIVVIPCLYGSDQRTLINKTVGLRVTKLLRNNDRCYFRNVSNSINSNNRPFYYYDVDRYGTFMIKLE